MSRFRTSEFSSGLLLFALGSGCNDRSYQPDPQEDQAFVSPSVDMSRVDDLDGDAPVSDANSEEAQVDAVDFGKPDAFDQAGPGSAVDTVSVGEFHTCVLLQNGAATCWGSGTVADANSPTNFGQGLAPPGHFTRIRAGWDHTCALDGEGRPICWGADGSDGFEPVPLAGDDRFVDLAPATGATCGLRSDGTVACWGGVGWFDVPLPEGQVFGSLDGSRDVCAINRLGKAHCTDRELEEEKPADLAFAQIAVGADDVCGLTADGVVHCWSRGPPDGPPLVPPGDRFSEIDLGSSYACGRRMNRSVRCWGISDEDMPGPYAEFSVGGQRGCGLRMDGRLECWGSVTLYGDPLVDQPGTP